MSSWAKEHVLQQAEERGVRFIRLQFADIFGILKNVAVTVNQLEKALDGKIMIDGSSINKYCKSRENDLFLRPDPSTFATFPWRPQEGAVARLICSIYNANGEPSLSCTRTVLKRVLQEAEGLGYSVNIGPEAEFFLFHVDGTGRPTTETHDKGGHFDLTPLDLGENARRDMIITLQDMGFEVETSHHEMSPGQHEIVFKSEDALTAADNIVTYKFVIRTIAQRHGLHATFMPKPIKDLAGSGMHLRFHLFKNNKKLFYVPDNSNENEDIIFFIGGLLKHAPALTALANPTVNSYKRLLGGHQAPKYIIWSNDIGNSFVRVPIMEAEESFIEWRSPDPSCNPYLAIAAAIKAGLEGIKEKVYPPSPVKIDPSQLPKSQIKALEIANLPLSLDRALDELRRDLLIRKALGEHLVDSYIKAKEMEWNSYVREVHDWEIKHYLSKF